VRLPIETFGYQYAIGGYHAVLSGFLLQFLALTIMAAIPRSSKAVRTRLEFVLGLTVPLALCCHAWVFPLQAALVGAWTLWDRRNSGHWHLLAPAAGAAAGVLLLLPFLAGLGAGAGYMQVALVTSDAHAPIVQFLIVWWPLLVLAFAVPLAGQARSFAGFLTLLFLALLIFVEFFSAPDGLYRDDFIRFNPSLKWWGWIFTGGVFSISAALLAGMSRVGRIAAASVLVLISVFAVDAGRYLVFRSHAFAGKIDGTRIARTAGCCATSRTPRRGSCWKRSMRIFLATPGSMAASRRSLTSSGSPTPSVCGRKSCRSCPPWSPRSTASTPERSWTRRAF
jgi:hypothetical protein